MTKALFVEAPQSAEERLYEAIAGSLIGTAAADALGWVTEFVRGREHLRKLYGVDRVEDYRQWSKTSGGRFFGFRDIIRPGEYSDDTQLTLAVARSLKADGSVDPEHFAKRELPLWLDYSRGAGSTITFAARELKRVRTRWDRNFFTYSHRGENLYSWESGANGAAMRVAPIALANIKQPEQMETAVWKSAIPTHGHPRAILGALLYAEALRCVACVGANQPLRTIVEGLEEYVTARQVPAVSDLQGWLKARPGGPEPFIEAWQATKREVVSGLRRILDARPGEGPAIMREFGCLAPETRGSGVGTVLAALRRRAC